MLAAHYSEERLSPGEICLIALLGLLDNAPLSFSSQHTPSHIIAKPHRLIGCPLFPPPGADFNKEEKMHRTL
jgi:hypothetical protein